VPEGGKLFRSTLAQYAAVAWTIAHLGGDVENEHGHVSADVFAALPDPSIWPAAGVKIMGQRVNELRELGLIEYERRGRRTYRMALMVEPDELPMPDPFPPPEPEPVETPHTTSAPPPILGEVEAPEPTPSHVDNLFGDNDAHLVAVALLREVLDRASGATGTESPVRAQRDHLARELADTKREARGFKSEAEVLKGRVQSLRVDLAEEKRLRAQVESNLDSVLGAVREYQGRLNGSLGEEQRKLLERMMRTVPGFDRGTVGD
jgi:hypothetical protein